MMLTGNILALKSVPSEEGPGTCFSSNTKGFFQKAKCFQKGPIILVWNNAICSHFNLNVEVLHISKTRSFKSV